MTFRSCCKNNYAISCYLRDIPIPCVFVGPLAGLDLALDVHEAALGQLVAAELGLLAPGDDAVSLGLLDLLAVLVYDLTRTSS